MLNLKQMAGSLALALACTTAGAGMHQICYEGLTQKQGTLWVPNGIFGCAVDGAGNTCTITPITNGFVSRSSYPLNQGVAASGNFSYYDFSSSAGTFIARMDFFDSNMQSMGSRNCTVNAVGVYGNVPGNASPNAVLTGFSSDASGLVTTGVWRLQGADTNWRRLSVATPGDFVAVGGGAMGVEAPMGALIAGSNRYVNYANDMRSWRATTSEASGAAQIHKTTAFVIGMHIQGMNAQSAGALLQLATATSDSQNPIANPATQIVPINTGSVIIGAGFDASAPGTGNLIGQFATMNAPVVASNFQCTKFPVYSCSQVSFATGWRAESKDHVISRPGWINIEMLSLPATINVNGVNYNVVSKLVSATSGETAHPAVDVSGLRGEYALTGIGATVNWRHVDQFGNQTSAGNLLWKLEPRADLGGASVASKDHAISSPASITGFALGIKLVLPAPPPPVICCRTFP